MHKEDHKMSSKIIEGHETSETISCKMSPKIMKVISPKIIKNVSFNMIIFHDIWWFFVTFDDYWRFFMMKSGDLSWFIVIYHDWSWQITNQLDDSSRSRRGTLKRWWHFVICVWESKQIRARSLGMGWYWYWHRKYQQTSTFFSIGNQKKLQICRKLYAPMSAHMQMDDTICQSKYQLSN